MARPDGLICAICVSRPEKLYRRNGRSSSDDVKLAIAHRSMPTRGTGFQTTGEQKVRRRSDLWLTKSHVDLYREITITIPVMLSGQ
jgi:hypothetical protein